jgi:predicted TIM-barrel fold metal-dependent hydrolase
VKVVDVHVHPVSREMLRDPRNLRFITHQSGNLLGNEAVRTLLERMDAGGIDKACLMGPNPHDGIALTNDMVHAMVAANPDRLVGFVGVDPCGDGRSVTKAAIDRAVDDWGFKGVGEIGGCDFLASDWDVVYESCMAKRIPVLVHVGIPLPSMLLKYGHPFLLDELAHRHPELVIIAAHAGAPWIIETVAVAVRHPNVYMDISTLPAVRRELIHVVLALCVERGLDDRVLFGSDFPVVDPCGYADTIASLAIPRPARWMLGLRKFSDELKEKVLWRNAARLLRLES